MFRLWSKVGSNDFAFGRQINYTMGNSDHAVLYFTLISLCSGGLFGFVYGCK